MGELAKILHKYGIVNAACRATAAQSSIMAYKGEVITRNSSANPTLGQKTATFLVAPKSHRRTANNGRSFPLLDVLVAEWAETIHKTGGLL